MRIKKKKVKLRHRSPMPPPSRIHVPRKSRTSDRQKLSRELGESW